MAPALTRRGGLIASPASDATFTAAELGARAGLGEDWAEFFLAGPGGFIEAGLVEPLGADRFRLTAAGRELSATVRLLSPQEPV